METVEDVNIQKSFEVLERAKTDNEKLAALLLFAKVTNSKSLSNEDRHRALDAIGVTFLRRLMKSKSVPEDCPETVYNSLALKILSGLCTDCQTLLQYEVYTCLRSVSSILADSSSEPDMVDDCYDLLSVFVQMEEGAIKLVDYGIVAALSEVVCDQMQGCDKGEVILQSVMYSCGEYAWKKDTAALHLLLGYFCKQLEKHQDEKKFEMCIKVSGVLSALPKDLTKNTSQRPWFKSLISSMVAMFTNKLGQSHRESALKLSSAVLDKLTVDSILPPHTPDCKLLLIVIHLSCIEVRMTLENLSQEQILGKTDTLVSCYNILESIISHMTSAPSLQLDENQVLQLHSAMEGAFNAVLFYLKEQSEIKEQEENPNQIVLASVRVLGSWVAEETSALKARVQDILPFISKLCQCQIEYASKDSVKKKVKFMDDDGNKDRSLVSELEKCSIEGASDNSKQGTENGQETVNGHQCGQENDNCSCSGTVETDTQSKCLKCAKLNSKASSARNVSDSCSDQTDSGCLDDQSNSVCSDNHTRDKSVQGDVTIANVDLIRFLLPGLCHMTADDSTRQILLDNGLHCILSKYLSVSVQNLEDTDTIRGLETLCGVLLNLAVLEPELVGQSEDLHQVTRVICKCLSSIYNQDDSLTLWANMVTLGVFFLRHQTHVKFEKDELTKFFSMVVTFIRSPYSSVVVNGTDVLTVTERYLPVWDSLYQLWYLCVQASTSCLPVYSSLVYAMMSTGFLPHIIRLLNKVQGRNVDEDTLLCLIGVITSLATTEVKARDVLKSCGGMEFSRLYNCSELEKLMEQ